MRKPECFRHASRSNPVTNGEADYFQIQPGPPSWNIQHKMLGSPIYWPRMLPDSVSPHASIPKGCSLTPYPPRTFPVPRLPSPAPILSSPPFLHTLLLNNAHPKKTTPQAGERPQQSSPAMRGIPACEPSREIHLCGPDSEELFGAKHCAIKWR